MLSSRNSVSPNDGVEPMSATQSLIRLPEVKRLTGLSRSTIYRLERDGRFVPRVRLGERATAWRLSEILAWIDARPAAQAAPIHMTTKAHRAYDNTT
jgi:prophage regulatory protein